MSVTKTELIDHIGWDLARAFSAWKISFNQKMVEHGCVWMAEARGGLLQHIGAEGVAQNELVQKAGLTKQAVQQQLDDLVKDGVVERVADEDDARKKRVQLTQKGIQVAGIANSVKRELESDMRRQLGAERFQTLQSALRAMIDPDASQVND